MDAVTGARTFATTGQAYDAFMGRYSWPLATVFADLAGVRHGRALDVGCGPGALTRVLVDRLGAEHVAAIDPSPPFVAECARRYPGVEVHQGAGESIPFQDREFDHVLAQLVLHFATDAGQVVSEFRRVLRPGGTAAVCVWDFAAGMQMLRLFWDAALALDPGAPDEARVLRHGAPHELQELLAGAGFGGVEEHLLTVSSHYSRFDELWSGFLAGIGPAGVYCVALDDDHRQALRDELFERLGRPDGGFDLRATARAATGRAPRQ